MYSVKPIGINIKDNDRDVPDGSLQESINMQWRDGAFKPIPERIISDINASGYSTIILHKVGDENTINVIGFNQNASSAFLAFDVSKFLGGDAIGGNVLEWFGTIINGVYQTKAITQFPFVATPGMSFTILNGLVYFMGDGSTPEEQYYFKFEFNETTGEYTLYDMYAWKNLIQSNPYQSLQNVYSKKRTYNFLASIGILAYRFALVLKSGEVVLPSPIYASNIYSITSSDEIITKGSSFKNIHTIIGLNLMFSDNDLFENEVSAINVYAAIPVYKEKFPFDLPGGVSVDMTNIDELENQILQASESQFYLIKTIEKPTYKEIILHAGDISDFNLKDMFLFGYYTIDMNTISAGEVMPADNFTYHRIFGKISSYNGRLDVIRPTTVLSGGHIKALSTTPISSIQGYDILTEDGEIKKILSQIDMSVGIGNVNGFQMRGILSYPDMRGTSVGFQEYETNNVHYFKLRKNTSHNIACAFGFDAKLGPSITFSTESTRLHATCYYDIEFYYNNSTDITNTIELNAAKYTSENRIQFSQSGEFKVWPAINSYRIGEGKVMNLGIGSVNPSESQIISPIIVGTTDGIYTINLDPSGTNFIASITKTANLPFLSEEILEIDQNILFVSDKGLMVFSDGNITNLTEAFFPQQGNGSYPTQEAVYPNYDVLTQAFFGVNGNPYQFADVVKYLKGALFAFDARRNNVWCSNPDYSFSLIYNLDVKQWGMSTTVFEKKIEIYSIINTEQEGELYTRYLVKAKGVNNLLVLSGEDLTKEVFYHVLTRTIKFQSVDDYKVLTRMFYRTMLQRKASATAGYFSIGLWGQQDVDRNKKAIPIVAKSDNRSGVYPGNIRYHIPIDCRKGKYKSITVLQSGKTLPESYISSFDFDVYSVDNTKMR